MALLVYGAPEVGARNKTPMSTTASSTTGRLFRPWAGMKDVRPSGVVSQELRKLTRPVPPEGRAREPARDVEIHQDSTVSTTTLLHPSKNPVVSSRQIPTRPTSGCVAKVLEEVGEDYHPPQVPISRYQTKSSNDGRGSNDDGRRNRRHSAQQENENIKRSSSTSKEDTLPTESQNIHPHTWSNPPHVNKQPAPTKGNHYLRTVSSESKTPSRTTLNKPASLPSKDCKTVSPHEDEHFKTLNSSACAPFTVNTSSYTDSLSKTVAHFLDPSLSRHFHSDVVPLDWATSAHDFSPYPHGLGFEAMLAQGLVVPDLGMSLPPPAVMEEYARFLQEQHKGVTGHAHRKQRPKKYRCPHCQVAFSNNGQLKGHVRIHTGERPFKCDSTQCGKTFTRNEELTRHKRIHSGLRPYPCPTCGKKFGRKDHLKKHARTHLAPPPSHRLIPVSLLPPYPYLYHY